MIKTTIISCAVLAELLFLPSLMTGCATSQVPTKGLPPITIEGIRNATSISIPVSYDAQVDTGKTKLTDGIDITQALSSDDAATIALLNNPQFNSDLAQLGISRGELIDAMQIRNPRIDFLYPLGAKPLELLVNLPIEMIWERPARIMAAEGAYERLAQSLVQNALNVVQDAKTAHADLILAKKREEILLQAFKLRRRISKINSGERVQVGEVTETEGIATEVDSALAEETWTQAKHHTALALERFKFALGLMFEDIPLKVKAPEAILNIKTGAGELVDKALEQRADLKAIAIGIISAAERAKWEASRISQLSILINSKNVGNKGILTGPGFSLELPIFHQNNGLLAKADAEVELLTRQFFSLRQRIAFEVRESWELLRQAHSVLLRTRTKILPLLKKTVVMAEIDYQNKAASYLFVLEQTRQLLDAQLREAEFETAVIKGQIQLSRATGGQL